MMGDSLGGEEERGGVIAYDERFVDVLSGRPV